MSLLDLNPDELLTTTRAVRKRLDFDKPVPRELIVECVKIAQQSPAGSNNPSQAFVVVTDPAKKKAIGAIYEQCWAIYTSMEGVAVNTIKKDTEIEQAQQDRVVDSATFLSTRMGDAPALVIACNVGMRLDGVPAMVSASLGGNVLPGMWSFMLAARARGLGTAWTTIHLMMEQQVADIVGIPFDSVQQMCLSPLAYTKGTDFKPAMRPDPETLIHWDQW
jgi:nitroreductase